VVKNKPNPARQKSKQTTTDTFSTFFLIFLLTYLPYLLDNMSDRKKSDRLRRSVSGRLSASSVCARCKRHKWPVHEACRARHLACVRGLLHHMSDAQQHGDNRRPHHQHLNQPDDDGFTPLLIASAKGHIEVVKYLCSEAKCDVNQIDDHNGRTPLYVASQESRIEVVKYLCSEAKCDVNQAGTFHDTPLCIASAEGHLEVVKYLCSEAKCDVNQAGTFHGTPLCIASAEGRIEVVKYLCSEAKCDVNQAGTFHDTPLCIASGKGHIDVVKYLCSEAKCDVNQADDIGWTPLYTASQNGHIEVVKYLCSEAKCDVNQANKNGWTPLYIASQNGHIEVVKYLCSEGKCDINQAEKNGATPLYIASQNGHIEVVKYLCSDAKCDVTQANKNGRTPLYSASQKGHIDVVKYLCSEAKCDVNQAHKNGRTPLYIASANGHIEVVKYLCSEAKCDVNQAKKNGATALYIASEKGHLEVVKYLCSEAKCDVNQASKDGVTPSLIASQNGHLEVVKYLCSEAKCDVNQAHKNGRTPLYIASANGHIEVVKYLCSDAKCDVNQANKNGASPLYIASQQGHIEVVKYLCSEAKCDVNQASKDGVTPLLIASQNGHLEVVKYLCSEAKCDVNQVDDDGRTPLWIASQNGHLEVVKYLCSEGKCDISQVDTLHGFTAVHAASKRGKVQCVQALITASPSCVLVQSNTGHTVLHLAALGGLTSVLRSILPVIDSFPDLINAVTHDGDTALHAAAKHGHADCMLVLLNVPQVNAFISNSNNQTALDLARVAEHSECIALLRDVLPCQAAAAVQLMQHRYASATIHAADDISISALDTISGVPSSVRAAFQVIHECVLPLEVCALPDRDSILRFKWLIQVWQQLAQDALEADAKRTLPGIRQTVSYHSVCQRQLLASARTLFALLPSTAASVADDDKSQHNASPVSDTGASDSASRSYSMDRSSLTVSTTSSSHISTLPHQQVLKHLRMLSNQTRTIRKALCECHTLVAAQCQNLPNTDVPGDIVDHKHTELPKPEIRELRQQFIAAHMRELKASYSSSSSSSSSTTNESAKIDSVSISSVAHVEALHSQARQLFDSVVGQVTHYHATLQSLVQKRNSAALSLADAHRAHADALCGAVTGNASDSALPQNDSKSAVLHPTAAPAPHYVNWTKRLADAEHQVLECVHAEHKHRESASHSMVDCKAVSQPLQALVERVDKFQQLLSLLIPFVSSLGQLLPTLQQLEETPLFRQICTEYEHFDTERRTLRRAFRDAKRAYDDENDELQPDTERLTEFSENIKQHRQTLQQHHRQHAVQVRTFVQLASKYAPGLLKGLAMQHQEHHSGTGPGPDAIAKAASAELTACFDTDGLYEEGLSLASFDDCKLHPHSSRHPIYIVSVHSRQYVLKEFTVSDTRKLMREARVLRSLNHAYIVPLERVICDQKNHKMYLQLPFYPATLADWMGGSSQTGSGASDRDHDIQVPTPTAILAKVIFRQLVLGVSHIHRSGILHCDLKPHNVFLTHNGSMIESCHDRKQPENKHGTRQSQHSVSSHCVTPLSIKIGDFDVSKSSEDRMTRLMTVTTAAGGFTDSYAAPEVLPPASQRANAASDVYSLGLLMYDVHPQTQSLSRARPRLQAQQSVVHFKPLDVALLTRAGVDQDFTHMLSAMLAEDVHKRPAAADLLAYPYFTKTEFELLSDLDEYRGAHHACYICGNKSYAKRGAVCPQGNADHFLCEECFTSYANASVTDTDVGRRQGLLCCSTYREKDDNPCSGTDLPCKPYADGVIARCCFASDRPEVFESYRAQREAIIEALITQDKDNEYKVRMQGELEELLALDALAVAQTCRASHMQMV
jgi:ankyrin repeat protein/serine/threonine protein kinase